VGNGVTGGNVAGGVVTGGKVAGGVVNGGPPVGGSVTGGMKSTVGANVGSSGMGIPVGGGTGVVGRMGRTVGGRV